MKKRYGKILMMKEKALSQEVSKTIYPSDFEPIPVWIYSDGTIKIIVIRKEKKNG